VFHASAAFVVTAARVVHQNPSHELRRYRKEVGAILPAHSLVIDQSQIGFVDQGGGLQAVVGAFPFQVMPCQAAEFVINDRGELIERGLVPGTPGLEQSADLVRNWRTPHRHYMPPSSLNYSGQRRSFK
jgi:hypothetical protein